MTTEKHQNNQRFRYAPFIDRWAVYDRRQNNGESVLCLTLSEEKAKSITDMLNQSQNVLDTAIGKLKLLFSWYAREHNPNARWDQAIMACCDELEGMRKP